MNKIELCKQIQTNIVKLSENEILEIFKIITKTNTNYTKNNNGIFLNLNWVENDTIKEIYNYINFCLKSHNEISKYELMKNTLNDSIKNKCKDDFISDIIPKETTDINNIMQNNKQKFSSSMKFYLLKKKFMKQNNMLISHIDNDLSYEDYLIS